MNESLSAQLKQAAFVLMHKLLNEAKIAELKKRISDKEKEIEDLRWNIDNIKKPSKSNSVGLFCASVCWLIFTIIATIFWGGIYAFVECSIFTLLHYFIFIRSSSNYKKKLKNYLESETENKASIEKIEKELPKIKEETQIEIEKTEKILNECFEEGKQFLDFLPQKYRNADAVCFMFEAVENCRADTLKEAINLYENELRYRKEQGEKILAAEQQAAYLQNLQSILQDIGENQDAINNNLTEIKTMQFFDMINK